MKKRLKNEERKKAEPGLVTFEDRTDNDRQEKGRQAYEALYKGHGIMALSTWVKFAGISTMTAWRWRERGILKTKNLCGRHYVTGESIVELQRLLESEKFAKDIKPKRDRKEAGHVPA
jgi:hypothetical protein